MRLGSIYGIFNTMHAMATYLLASTVGDTICEIAGGEARTTRILIRLNDPRISTGPNFDLIADIDLTNQSEQASFWKYRKERRPKVCVMAPMCRSFGGRSRMNKILHPVTWQRHHDSVDRPLAQFAGYAAVEQLKDLLDFVNEQPVGSSLYQITPWPEVLDHPRVRSTRFDQCQLGQRSSKEEPVKKFWQA